MKEVTWVNGHEQKPCYGSKVFISIQKIVLIRCWRCSTPFGAAIGQVPFTPGSVNFTGGYSNLTTSWFP